MSSIPSDVFSNIDQLTAALSTAGDSSIDVPTTAFDQTPILTQTSQVHFRSNDVTPPADLYVTLNDSILVTVWALQAGIPVQINGRLMLPDGTIQLLNLVTNSPSFANSRASLNLSEGFLLDLIATCPQASITRGQVFVQVALVHGQVGNQQKTHVLLQDYVWSSSVSQWPGSPVASPLEGPGLIQSLVLAVAVNTQISFLVTGGTRVRLKYLYGDLVSSAAAGTRVPVFIATTNSGVTRLWFSSALNGQGPSLTNGYSLIPGLPSQELAAVFGAHIIGAPPSVILTGGQFLQSLVGGFGAGDQWQNVCLTTETWIDPQDPQS